MTFDIISSSIQVSLIDEIIILSNINVENIDPTSAKTYEILTN